MKSQFVVSADTVLDFLLLLTVDRRLRAVLATHRFDEHELAQGYALLQNAETATLEARRNDPEVVEAEIAVEAWIGRALRRAARVLARDFPEQHAFLTEGLAPARGIAAVPLCRVFLWRVEALDARSRCRTPLAQADAAAIGILERRHCTPVEVARTRARLECIYAAARVAGRNDAPSPELRALGAWYAQWARIARAMPAGEVILREAPEEPPLSNAIPDRPPPSSQPGARAA